MIALKGKEYCKEDLFLKFSKAMLYSKWKKYTRNQSNLSGNGNAREKI